MPKVLMRIVLMLFCCYALLSEVSGQPSLSFDLKKPKKFEDKPLGSEKTATKKFTIPRRFIQNGITKFNWHFNANVKLTEVIARAKAAYKDDYSELLAFYNYNLDYTSVSEKTELDSVIYKANSGILIHDLRNSWIDNLYMLMGKAYYFKKELDTAYLTFQYINYAFSPKEKDGYDIPIGSNATEGNNAFTISTKEKRNLLQQAWSRAPSRNESFIWQIRTYLAKDEIAEAAGLIETLKHDPQFPDRLKTDLKEVQAWWFYKQQVFDSAAIYLEMALPNAENKQEEARWEYLIAQLYERAHSPVQAEDFYNRAARHTFNPVLEVYARLNSIRQHKGDDKTIQENIDALAKMARRDKYLSYRQIIYYAAAQMELERNNITGAKALLLRATRYSTTGDDNSQRSKCFLLLADLLYKEKDYPESKRFYDSVNNGDMAGADLQFLEKRKAALGNIVRQLQIIYRQDSLQRIAVMPEQEREALLRKMARQLRKQKGLKEEEFTSSGGPLLNNNDNQPSDLFNNNAKGDWYFNNTSLKAKGFTEFKNKWGNRPNTDNWRRAAAVSQAVSNQQQQQQTVGNVNLNGTAQDQGNTAPDSYEGLLKNIPLTPQQKAQSDDSIENAKLKLGKGYVDDIEDYESAITVLEEFIGRFPNSISKPEAIFYLHYCYLKTGRTAKATSLEQDIKQQYPSSPYAKRITDPAGADAAKTDMTRRYDNIYNLFIEGNFTEALAQKRIADSMYGKNYWTPQLLYIQSVYHIRERQDDSAKKALQNIIGMYPASPLAAKAKTLLDVLSRRKEIEDYLTNLKIERPKEDTLVMIDDSPVKPVVARQPPVVPKKDTVQAKDSVQVVTKVEPKPSAITKPAVKKDSTQAPVIAAGKDSLKTVAPPVANKDSSILAKPPVAQKDTTQTVPPVVVKNDTVQVKPSVPQKDSTKTVVPPPVVPKKDSIQAKPVTPPAPVINSVFTLNAAAPHYVAIVMDKVDPVYVTETRNAFNRYNKENYAGKAIDISNITLNDDIRLVLMNNFGNAAEAIAYIEKARKTAATETIPWLPAAKYSFITISAQNLDLLKNNKDVKAYKDFLLQAFPGKF